MRNRTSLLTTTVAVFLLLAAAHTSAQGRRGQGADEEHRLALAAQARQAAGNGNGAELHSLVLAQIGSEYLDDAVESLQQLGRLCPRSLEVSNNLAVALAAIGEYDQALSELRRLSDTAAPAANDDTLRTIRQNRLSILEGQEFWTDREALPVTDTLDLTLIERIEPCVPAGAVTTTMEIAEEPEVWVPPPTAAPPVDTAPVGRPPDDEDLQAVEEDDTEEEDPILDAVEAWADAWQEQRVDDYLAAYSRRFTPNDGFSWADWANLRRGRIEAKEFIEIGFGSDPEVVEGTDRATVRFVQTYRSNNFGDTVVKTLGLVLEDGGWKIVSETAVDE